MNSLATQDLCHRFQGGEQVLNQVNLEVPEGSIYGFLGPNGAGKTTTLRLVLGLLKKQTGKISFFGVPFEQNRISILKNVGSLIESPSLYGHLSARDNLRIWQKIYRTNPHRIEAVLRLVDLANTGSKKTSRFSLGMKQRLSIAVALLHEPRLLILDEPTNGLDPNGMIEMRELLRKLNQELGITIVISSHLLSEIERLVTHAGVIHQGKLLFQGRLEELVNQQQKTSSIQLATSENEKARQWLQQYTTVREANGYLQIPALPNEKIGLLNRGLVQEGIDVYEISTIRNDLESVFMDLINN